MHHFFLPRDHGQRLCVHHAPAAGTATRATLVHVPAFGEEMNKSRHMVARQCRSLAEAGCATLQIDLLGCGDSSGEHAEASWDAWLADVHAACDWMEARHPGVPRWLWGQRTGAMLATEVLAMRPGVTHLLLWQPMQAGRTLVQQLYRLRAAAHLGDPAASKQAMAAMREDVDQGRDIEVAGYTLNAGLVRALEAAALRAPQGPGQVCWFEVAARAQDGLSPAARKVVDDWTSAGVAVRASQIEGPAFWQATEIEWAPRLVEATTQAVLETAEVPA